MKKLTLIVLMSLCVLSGCGQKGPLVPPPSSALNNAALNP